MVATELKINPEFEKLIPPLTKDEYEQLEKNVLAEGIRDALVTWRGTLIDGHNRYRIAENYGLPYSVVEKHFENEDQVKVWMIDNQKGRRNLTDGWKFELAIKRKQYLSVKAKETQGTRTDLVLVSDTKLNGRTRDVIANDLGWSTGKTAKAEVVYKNAPEVFEKIKSGEYTVDKAYTEVKKEEKKQEVRKKENEHKEEIKDVSDFDIDIFTTDRKFNIIYADPAWKYWESGEKNQELHYSTMTIDEIKKLPVSRIADENCVLFIWVTFPILREAFDVIESWGFQYSTCGFNWVKKNKNADSWFFGNGAWTRANSELCLIAKRGSVTRIDASISQVLDDPISEHSRKPARVRSLITQLVGELPRIELFSRNQNNDGWFNWGNQI